MKRTLAVKATLLLLIIAGLTISSGCEAVRGGTEATRGDISLDALSMRGKLVQGLPVGNLNAILKVKAGKITINPTSDRATINAGSFRTYHNN